MRKIRNYGLRTKAIIGERPLTKATGRRELRYYRDTPKEEIELCLQCDLPQCVEWERTNLGNCEKVEALRRKVRADKKNGIKEKQNGGFDEKEG